MLTRPSLLRALRRATTPRLVALASVRGCSTRKDALEAAKHAIATAERSAGELDAAERAAAATEDATSPAAADSAAASAPRAPPRFPLGATVECRLGPEKWALGRIVGLHYREPSWPADRRAPYQVRLEEGPLIYAPEDVDECVRTSLRFPVGSVVECNVDVWRRGTVVAHYWREPEWPPDKWAPYAIELEGGRGQVYAPVDSDDCVREPVALGWPWPGADPPPPER